MGNVQTASIGNQIAPTEAYIQEINELRYVKRHVFTSISIESLCISVWVLLVSSRLSVLRVVTGLPLLKSLFLAISRSMSITILLK